MKVLVDTGILLRLVDLDDPIDADAVATVDKLLRLSHELGMTPQCCREFWNVATRPKKANGLGLESTVAERLLVDLALLIAFWDDTPSIFAEWRRLVNALSIRGVQVHDANHAAAAIAHGATHILTLNKRDFERYSGFGVHTLTLGDV